MSQCLCCPKQSACRVPRDLKRFDAVAHRLEDEHRQPMLQQRLHHYLEHAHCLVDAGYVDL
ncbi:MAG: hypothetical protein H7Z12_18360 [Rhodospirillaceae bacterium]|nr:hypothetical protein [Rhodospirillales bacterium]